LVVAARGAARGASRYYDPDYRDGFALECAGVKMVREEFGLTNLDVMIPFCRTITEAKKVTNEGLRTTRARTHSARRALSGRLTRLGLMRARRSSRRWRRTTSSATTVRAKTGCVSCVRATHTSHITSHTQHTLTLRVGVDPGMCEIPSNVILAREFLGIFDGYSIGSNDLTQLCLGVDRDSAIVSK
jgi:pyruvate,water dikinase